MTDKEPRRREPLRTHPQTSSLMFQTHTCQFKVGLLQGAQQNVLWLQIQVRDVPFMQKLQGTSWGIGPTQRTKSAEPVSHLRLASPGRHVPLRPSTAPVLARLVY